ncbi:MAG: hypothetical protein J5I90_18640, partial [Caldilineales bacterium]|nr:hypothetical protein [Caldilineales bacterium]
APRDELEHVVVEMWSEVLSVQQVGVFDNFFLLGGDSLSAARLLTRLEQAFHVRLELQSLFRSPTVAGHVQLLIEAVARDEAQA